MMRDGFGNRTHRCRLPWQSRENDLVDRPQRLARNGEPSSADRIVPKRDSAKHQQTINRGKHERKTKNERESVRQKAREFGKMIVRE